MHGRLHPAALLAVAHLFVGRAAPGGHRLERAVPVKLHRATSLLHVAVPALVPLHVDRLVGGDRVDPRPKGPAVFEPVALEVHPEERRLKHVFGQFGVPEIAGQIAKQGLLVAMDERFVGPGIAGVTKLAEQFFVGQHVGGHGGGNHDASPQPFARPLD